MRASADHSQPPNVQFFLIWSPALQAIDKIPGFAPWPVFTDSREQGGCEQLEIQKTSGKARPA